ncbi:PAS domain-containing protein [Leptolyngbya sp. FACHB-261]|uniref:PAS domain-containing protein n=1 Tax=Leptolyngbya sp. FACHB-261 TaxID=2692806 RepID=UPI0018EF6394|nr:helix-turn-helix domain-containing protein [Leptolyngbya sp. FACHB-261]
MHWRLATLYEQAEKVAKPHPMLPPQTFLEIGRASEELQVAAEELCRQNEKLAEALHSLETERQRYRNLFEFAPDGYVVIDLQGTIQEANRAAAILLNAQTQFLVGKPLSLFVAKDARQSFNTELLQFRQAIERSALSLSGRRQEWTMRLQPHHGQVFDAALSLVSSHNQVGDPVILCWFHALAERKGSNSALAEPNNADSDRMVQSYVRGEVIPLVPQSVWQIRQGLVKLTTVSARGEEVLIGLVGSSMPFGPDLTALPVFQATALSEQVQLVSIPLVEVAASPKLAQALLQSFNQRLQHTEALLAISGELRVNDRLHQLLQLLKREVGEPTAEGTRLGVRLTHEDLANACCTSRVTITRLLSKLQRQGKLSFCPKRHMILAS